MNRNPMAFKKAFVLGGAVVSALLGAGSAFARTYIVDQTILDGTVTGTITTNGTIGTLDSADITSWDLVLTGPGPVTYTLTPSATDIVTILGDDVVATATEITFNYSGTDDGYLLFQNDVGAGNYFWCNTTAAGGGRCDRASQSVEVVAPGNYLDASAQYAVVTGNNVIAIVPEPSTWAMMLVGLAGLGFLFHRRQQRAATAA